MEIVVTKMKITQDTADKVMKSSYLYSSRKTAS